MLRWNVPECGMVSPGEFIPVAEQSCAIIPLGNWALDRACEDFKEMYKKGLPYKLSANV
ncbi:EAL domain-containing protein [Peribacillus kribbensis]|uniref:EAL domain-containing protein n=1 Tax=Peribacillus kribbensis TaxID=356658 RepID=UPI0009D687F9